jgi:hypothetical protein
MNPFGRICRGTLWGVLAAWLGFPAMASFYGHPGMSLELGPMLATMVLVLPFLAILATPGAFLLSCLHAYQMERWAPRARSVGHLRQVGILLGLPLGVANLALVFALTAFFAGQKPLLSANVAPWLIPALAGGAGLGWGVTIGLTPGRAAPARTTARPRPMRKLRRDGPPFFDDRASRRVA